MYDGDFCLSHTPNCRRDVVTNPKQVSPSSLGNDHLGAQGVELVPEALHLEGGVDGGQLRVQGFGLLGETREQRWPGVADSGHGAAGAALVTLGAVVVGLDDRFAVFLAARELGGTPVGLGQARSVTRACQEAGCTMVQRNCYNRIQSLCWRLLLVI